MGSSNRPTEGREGDPPELLIAQARLEAIREELRQALKKRSELDGEARDVWQGLVEKLQAEEADIVEEIRQFRLSETKQREEESKSRKQKKKKQSARRRELETRSDLPEDYDAAVDWAEAEAIDHHLNQVEEADREEREHNQELFDRLLAVERREAEVARQRAIDEKLRQEAELLAQQERQRKEEARVKAEQRKAESLEKKKQNKAAKAHRADDQVRRERGEQPASRWSVIKEQVKQFWRELFGGE